MRMSVNGLQAELNMPDAPKGGGIHGLPPYCRQKVFVVDEYPACPTNWMHGSSKTSSYFAALRPGAHMWFDFNMNWNYSHHIAIVCSIQGINPITGQQTKVLRLEQYKEKCPVHDAEFKQDRFCEKCEYKWPAQNYLTTVSTPEGLFWIDGFRAEDGKIRGFLVTEDMEKGVAAQIIGEDRVWAVGIAFYLSKEPWTRLPTQFLRNQGFGSGHSAWKSSKQIFSCGSTGATLSINSDATVTQPDVKYVDSGTVTCSAGSSELDCDGVEPISYSGAGLHRSVKKLEIAAGANIVQELNYPDPSKLEFYEDEPIGVIYMNFTNAESVVKILQAGQRDLTAGGEGFLAPLKTGNP